MFQVSKNLFITANLVIDDSDEEVPNWRNKPSGLVSSNESEFSSKTNVTYIFILLITILLLLSWLKRNKGLPLRRIFGYFVRNRYINLNLH